MTLAHRVTVVAAILSSAICGETPLRAEPPVWKPIMDGQTLAGWHKNGLGDWTVEDGAFVGRSNNEPRYGHLVSDNEFKDFTVRFRFQCTSGDSGFFIRTQMEEPDKTNGLQIQVGPCKSGTGGIYESYGRGWLQEPTDEQEAFCYREGTWNEMIIAAHGPRVTVHVNGFKTADLNDKQIKQGAGVLALQMHSKNVNHTVFKDLAILKQGKVVPRKFLYGAVQTVEPAKNGTIILLAAAAMTSGPNIAYQPAWNAAGPFAAKDLASWPVNIKQAGSYDVWLASSAEEGQGGRPITIAIGEQQITGKTSANGSPASFQKAKIGQLVLKAGVQQAELRATGKLADASPLRVRQITLVPVE